MESIPTQGQAFVGLIDRLFPGEEETEVALRYWQLPGGPVVSVAHISALAQPRDLQEMVLEPLFRATTLCAPHQLLYTGLFPAPVVKSVYQAQPLQDGLLAGLIAVHIDGYGEALLVGSGQPSFLPEQFGADLAANKALLYRTLRVPELRFESIQQPNGNRAVVAYLSNTASAKTVDAVVDWAAKQSLWPKVERWWRMLPDLFRLPKVAELSSPGLVAEALRRGYIVLLFDHLPGAYVAPVTFEILMTGPDDVTLSTVLRRASIWLRYLLAATALVVGGHFTAITSYHHAMLPGPFLVALSTARQAQPLPVFVEILLGEWLDDALWAASLRMGGRRWSLIACLGTILGIMAGFQAGLLSPIPAIIGIISAVCLQALPSSTVVRRIRLWRPFFALVGVGLGMWAISLLEFALMAYLAEERYFGHRLRENPGGERL